MKTEEKIVTYCRGCNTNTNQTILYTHKDRQDLKDGRYNVFYQTLYYTIKCMGCDTVSFLMVESSTYHVDNEGYPKEVFFIYPQPRDTNGNNENAKQLSKNLPKSLQKIYLDVIELSQSDSDILTGIGLRILLEGVCINRRITGRNLKEKIENLFVQGFIAKKDLTVLHRLREIGNVSAHKIIGVPHETIINATKIVNHLLQSIYVIQKQHRKLKLRKGKNDDLPF